MHYKLRPPLFINGITWQKAFEAIKDFNITIEAVYLGSDALSQVVGLSRPSQVLKPMLRRLYANINLHLLKLANLTGQKKKT